MAALMKPAGATRPCLHQGNPAFKRAASQCATAPSSSLMRCASGSGSSASPPSISSPEARGRTAISKASMPVCAMNCSTARSSTALRRCGSSPAGGAIIQPGKAAQQPRISTIGPGNDQDASLAARLRYATPPAQAGIGGALQLTTQPDQSSRAVHSKGEHSGCLA